MSSAIAQCARRIVRRVVLREIGRKVGRMTYERYRSMRLALPVFSCKRSAIMRTLWGLLGGICRLFIGENRRFVAKREV